MRNLCLTSALLLATAGTAVANDDYEMEIVVQAYRDNSVSLDGGFGWDWGWGWGSGWDYGFDFGTTWAAFDGGGGAAESDVCEEEYMGICISYVPAYDVLAVTEGADQQAVDILNQLTDAQLLDITAATLAIGFQGDLVQAFVDYGLDPTAAIDQFGAMQNALLTQLYTYGVQNGTIGAFPEFMTDLW